jgi:hypothetical protein
MKAENYFGEKLVRQPTEVYLGFAYPGAALDPLSTLQ